MFGDSGRSVVGIPAGQRRQEGSGHTRKVLNCVEMKTYAVQYEDEQGNVVIDAMQCVGGLWHKAPNGENYAATLKALPVDHWLAKQLTERVAGENTASIPKQDAVDITSGG